MANIHPSALLQNTKIRAEYVGPYCIIGYPAENIKTWPETPFGVSLGTDTVLTGHVTIDAGTIRDTFIGDKCLLMKGVHVGHDAVIGNNVIISCHAIIGGHVVVSEGCNIGLGAIILPRQHIPPYCMIGAGAVVTKTAEIKPFGVWMGNPARFHKFNHVAVERFGLTAEQVTQIQEQWIEEHT